MYSAFIGFVLTFIIGLVLSYILTYFNKQGRERIYVDDTKTIINADLFLPPKAKSIRKRNAVFEKKARAEEEAQKYWPVSEIKFNGFYVDLKLLKFFLLPLRALAKSAKILF